MEVSMNIGYFIAPVVVIIAGIILLLTSKVKINSFYGFRTKTASKNQQTWEYCNRLYAKILIVIGTIFTIIVFITKDMTVDFLGRINAGEFVNILLAFSILPPIPIVNCCCKRKFPELYHNNRDK